ALTKVIAEQFGEQGVRAITISPGPVNTQVWTDPDGFIARLAQVNGVGHQEMVKTFLDTLGPSTGRITTPQEAARLIAFAASPHNITGADLIVDGGIAKAL